MLVIYQFFDYLCKSIRIFIRVTYAVFEHTAAAEYVRKDLPPTILFPNHINGVIEPVAGEKPVDAAHFAGSTASICTDDDIAESAGDGIYWTADSDGGAVMSPDQTFEKGKTYTIWVRLTPSEGGRFYSTYGTVYGTVNGAGAVVKNNSDEKTIFVTKSYTIPKDPEYLRGDVNFDGKIAVEDAQMALTAYVKQLSGKMDGLSNLERLAADADGNGKVEAEDAQLILQYYVRSLAGKNISWESMIPAKN